MKKIALIVLLVAAVITAIALGIGESTLEAEGVCSVTVSCETILENGANSKEFTENGLVLKVEHEEFFEGDSAFDVISRVLEENDVEAVFEDSAYGKYITEIAGIKEGDFGKGSGWLFMVNGEFADVGCSSYKVQTNDVLQVVYTCDMGNDIN